MTTDDRYGRRDANIPLWTLAAMILIGTGLFAGWIILGPLCRVYHGFLMDLFGVADGEKSTISRNPLKPEGLELIKFCAVPVFIYLGAWAVWVKHSPAIGRWRDIWKLAILGALVALLPAVVFSSIGEWLLIDAF